ncbi:hypothetical protein QP496_23995, partial [Klebsiella pneumoniae]|uniref:hypothetical protein n=1 Tax=Klebsiella pneumoniae TaxID=573 RepID=UPI0025567B4C
QSLQFRNGSVSRGDVFVSSWGYEQTNTCFYQVIALRGKKTAVLRRIAAQQVKADSAMSGELKPVLNDFKGEPVTRRICENHEHPSVSIDEYEQAYKTDPNESHFYSTWG